MGTIIGAGNPAHAVVACADASHQGCWTVAFSPLGNPDPGVATEQKKLNVPAAASAVVLPNGRIVYWNGLQNLEECTQFGLPTNAGSCAGNSISELLDLTGESSVPFFAHLPTNGGDDLFCADQRLLQTGDVFVSGGTHWVQEIAAPGAEHDPNTPGLAELYGSKDSHTFNFNGDGNPAWNDASRAMKHGRWYPSMLTLSSGNQFITGGVQKLLWNSSLLPAVDGYNGDEPLPANVKESEVYDIVSHKWTAKGDSVALPLFARIRLLPNGDVYYSGVGQMWGPAGESTDQLDWNYTKFYDGTTWRNDAMPAFGARSGTFSAMLPLTPPYDKAQFVQGGGVLGTSPGGEIATNLSELLTVGPGSDGKWHTTAARTGDMANSRWYSSSVVLPNGQVLAFSGANVDEVVVPGIESAIRQAELYDPATKTWTALSSSLRDRTYHNSALLLADGSVLVGGHAPINQGYNGKAAANNWDNGFSNNFKDPSFERYYPPYLFAGDRPVIDEAQAGATWGGNLEVDMQAGSTAPAKFVLSRTPAVTHTTDADNRTVEVPFSATEDGDYSLHIPSNSNVVPPGYYYAFAVSSAGVPSVAAIVKIASPSYLTGLPDDVEPVNLITQSAR
jgi:hypothetical protein